MTVLKSGAALVLCLAAMVAGAQPSFGAVTLPAAAVSALGSNIGASAARGESGAQPGGIQAAVRVSVQRAIILAGAEPRVVLAALDSAIANCRARAAGWTCPVSDDAYTALAGLRGIVIAQLELTDPAALDTPGTAGFGGVPSITPGASYSVVR
jgi:hypothetical protein